MFSAGEQRVKLLQAIALRTFTPTAPGCSEVKIGVYSPHGKLSVMPMQVIVLRAFTHTAPGRSERSKPSAVCLFSKSVVGHVFIASRTFTPTAPGRSEVKIRVYSPHVGTERNAYALGHCVESVHTHRPGPFGEAKTKCSLSVF